MNLPVLKKNVLCNVSIMGNWREYCIRLEEEEDRTQKHFLKFITTSESESGLGL